MLARFPKKVESTQNRPQSAFFIEEKSFDFVFGPEQREALLSFGKFDITEPITALSEYSVEQTKSIKTLFTGWGVPPMDDDFLSKFPDLEIVFHAAGSIKSLATDAFWERGIRVTSAARANAIPVAEFVFSQIVFCLKHGWQTAIELRERGHYRLRDERIPGTVGATVGILSLGHTGQEVTKRLKALDLNIIAYDPYANEKLVRELGVERVSLDELFSRSDIVTCHTPLLPETTGFLRGHHFEKMRDGSSFINTARGSIVNEAELVQVLKARPELFAVLDVTHPEPPLPNSPILTLPNAILTPHIAGSLSKECRAMGQMMVDEFKRYLDGKPLEGELYADQLDRIA